MRFKPHDYQKRMIRRVIDTPKIGLFLDMGLGKTVIALTAVEELMFEEFAVSRVLVIAPKRVAQDTWSREHEKWDHLKDLRISLVTGTAAQRKKALATDADVYVIGRDNVVWLTQILPKWDYFDMVIIDELSSFKSNQAKRFKELKKVLPALKRVVGLTGTPSPNSLMDLWAELYLLDRGERLGKTIGCYREEYFRPGKTDGHHVFSWEPRKGSQEKIEKLISDICVSMSAEEYLTLPDRIDVEVPVALSQDERAMYEKMERDQILTMDDEEVVALNAAAVMGKLLQMANGCVYTESGGVVRIHEAKLDKLEEIVDTAGEPVLVFYNFKHDKAAIEKRIKGVREITGPKDIKDWNAGKIPVLLAHPASVGYGLNLQDGGHVIVWYGLTWSLELYQQANARLYRQGQQKPVIVHHLIAEGTVDEQVMRAIKHKDTSQAALLAALKERKGGL